MRQIEESGRRSALSKTTGDGHSNSHQLLVQQEAIYGNNSDIACTSKKILLLTVILLSPKLKCVSHRLPTNDRKDSSCEKSFDAGCDGGVRKHERDENICICVCREYVGAKVTVLKGVGEMEMLDDEL